MKEDFLSKIATALKNLEGKSLVPLKTREANFRGVIAEYLRHNGWFVEEPKEFKHDIKKLDDLINLFYNYYNYRHPQYYKISPNMAQDREIAKAFLKGRMEVNKCSKEYALNECGEIVKTFIESLDSFEFETITFSLFGQKKLKWVTDRVIGELNKRLEIKRKDEHNALLDMAGDFEDGECKGYEDLSEILTAINKENSNGKEK